MFHSVVVESLILHVMPACLSYKSAYLSLSIVQKALTDDFPFDLPQLIDGVAPNKKKMKNVFGGVFFTTIGETNPSTDKHAIISLYVKQVLTHSNVHTNVHAHIICLPLQIKHTPTYVAAVLKDGMRGGPHLPKCLCWSTCSGVMND